MLDILLCIAAAPGAALQDPDPPHLRAAPERITGLVAVNDLPDLLEKGRQNSWYRFFLDPQLAEFREWLDELLEDAGREAEASGLPSPTELVNSIDAISLFLAPGAKTPFGALGIVVQARDEHDALSRFVDGAHMELESESQVSVETRGTVPVRVYDYTEAGKGFDAPGTVAAFEVDGVFVFVAAKRVDGDRAYVLEVAQGCLDRIADDAARGVLANERFIEARGPESAVRHLEGFIDVPSLTSYIPKDRDNEPIVEALVDSISSIPWVYGSARLGAGEELESQLGFRCDPNSLLGQFLSLGRPVPREMLKLLPQDSVAISLGAFDLDALVDMLLSGIYEYGPEDAETHVQASLGLVRGQFGLDPIDDFVRLFSGEFAFFQRAPASASEDAPGAKPAPGQVFSMMETMILGLNDGEAFADNVEQVLTRTGLEAYLEADDFEDVDIYSLPPSLQLPLAWIITEEFLAVSGRREDLEHLIVASRDGAASVLNDPRLTAAFDQAKGSSLFSVSDTAAVLKLMGEIFDVIASTSDVSEDAADFRRMMTLLGSDGILAQGLIDKYFRGLMYSSWKVEDGRVRLQTWGR